MPVVAELTTPWANVARHVFWHARMGHAASSISSSGGELLCVCSSEDWADGKVRSGFSKNAGMEARTNFLADLIQLHFEGLPHINMEGPQFSP